MAELSNPASQEVIIKPQDVVVMDKHSEPSMDAERLIALAIEKNTPIESLEKLLAMRRELKEERAKELYFKALARFQSECPTIPKTRNVKYTSVDYNYAPLDLIVSTVKETLMRNGFSYDITTEQTDTTFTAICNAHHEAGYSKSTRFIVPIDSAAKMNSAQKVASANTYAKRYAFCNAFGIMTGDEDDDGVSTGERTSGAPSYSRRNENPKSTPVSGAREKVKAEIESIIEEAGFPRDKAADIKKYIARGDANLEKALQRTQEIARAARNEPAQLSQEDSQMLGDEDLGIPPTRKPKEEEMFEQDPYHHGG